MRIVLWALLLVVGLAGCGGESGDGDGTDAEGTHPFSEWDRCYVDYDANDGPPEAEHVPDDAPRPGCSEGGEQNLLSSGATLTSRDGDEAMFDLTYRGGFTQRGDTDDPTNPEYLGIAVAFDVTVRSDVALPLSGEGLEHLSVAAVRGGASQGTATLGSCSSNGVVPTGRDHRIEPGETVTVLYCFYSAGPPEFVDGDPYVEVHATSFNGSPGYGAVFAVDESLPVAALEDVRASIDRMAEIQQLDGYDWGAAAFDDRYGDVTEDLVTSDRRGEGADQASEPAATDTGAVAPPPPPPTPSADETETEEATGQSDDPAQGTDNLRPAIFESARALMADRLPADADAYLDCSVAGAEKPCIEVVLEDAGDQAPEAFEASVGVRYTVTGDPGWRDVYLLLGSDTGLAGEWEIVEEWVTGPDRPLWAG